MCWLVLSKPLTHLNLTGSAIQLIYTLIAGLGLGGLFFPPLVGLQAAMPGRDMATSTATLGLLRLLGSTVGVSVGQAIWSSVRIHVLCLSHQEHSSKDGPITGSSHPY